MRAFHLAETEFQVLQSTGAECFMSAEGTSAPERALRDLLRRSSDSMPELPALRSEAAVVKEEVPQKAMETLALDGDSDDEEDDHPLRGLAPLSPLQAPPDTCADLLLVQPPKFLRSGYEMLLGPSKDAITPLSTEVLTSSGTAPEPPSTARARIATALSSLPSLVKVSCKKTKHIYIYVYQQPHNEPNLETRDNKLHNGHYHEQSNNRQTKTQKAHGTRQTNKNEKQNSTQTMCCCCCCHRRCCCRCTA